MNQYAGRIEYIDTLKGIAIILVLIGHIIPHCFGYTDDPIYRVIYSFHMPLFIFLSGFLCNTRLTLKKRTEKAIKLLSPFFCSVFLYSVYANITVSQIMFAANKMGFWYLMVLAVFYLVMPGGKQSDSLKAFIYECIHGCIVMFLFVIAYFSLPTYLYNLFCVDSYIHLWPFFFLGSLTRKYNFIEYLKNNNILFSFAFIAYFISFSMYTMGWPKIIICVTNLSAVMVFFYVFSNMNNTAGWGERMLRWFGRNTLYIYIFHFFITRRFASVKELGTWFFNTQNYLVEVLFLFAYSFVIACISIFIGKIIRTSNILGGVMFGDYACKLINKKEQ